MLLPVAPRKLPITVVDGLNTLEAATGVVPPGWAIAVAGVGAAGCGAAADNCASSAASRLSYCCFIASRSCRSCSICWRNAAGSAGGWASADHGAANSTTAAIATGRRMRDIRGSSREPNRSEGAWQSAVRPAESHRVRKVQARAGGARAGRAASGGAGAISPSAERSTRTASSGRRPESSHETAPRGVR